MAHNLFGPNVVPVMNPQQIAHQNLLNMMGPEAAFQMTHMNEFRDHGVTIAPPKAKGEKVKKKLFGSGSNPNVASFDLYDGLVPNFTPANTLAIPTGYKIAN